MKKSMIITQLNKVFESMVSSAAGIVGVESLPKKKKMIKKYNEKLIETKKSSRRHSFF